MLSKENRLQKDKEFRRVFKFSKPSNVGHIAVRCANNNLKNGATRVGFVISNKVNKRSTRRNALKRRLRSAMRELLPKLKPGYDIVVIVKFDYPIPYNFELIKKELREGAKTILSS